jgi:chromosome segregation ATPase
MKLFTTLTVCSVAAVLCAPGALFAQAPAAEAQLREALRTTTIQLRAAQGELAAANAEKEQALADKTALAKQLDSVTRQAAADRAAAQANLANLNAQLAAKDAEAARLAGKLKTALDTGDGAARLAQQRADALARNELTRVELERSVAELRSHNRELFRIGNEVLDRYAAFGLGEAIAAREPFTKLTRVKLQTLVQDYRDNLEDNRAKLPPAPAATSASAPAS